MLPKQLRQEMVRFFSRISKVKRVILFGSRARGDGDPRSDVDLAVSAPQIGERQWLDIVFFLKEEIKSLLTFDVIRLEEASPKLKKRIHEEGRLIYGKK